MAGRGRFRSALFAPFLLVSWFSACGGEEFRASDTNDDAAGGSRNDAGGSNVTGDAGANGQTTSTSGSSGPGSGTSGNGSTGSGSTDSGSTGSGSGSTGSGSGSTGSGSGGTSGSGDTATGSGGSTTGMGGDASGGDVDAPCENPIDALCEVSCMSGQFGTTGPVCYRVTDAIAGWGCANADDRKVFVNGEETTCGALLPDAIDGAYYFAFGDGLYAYASFFWWQ
jgi:hypothetical protein